jgi:GTP-binding protein
VDRGAATPFYLVDLPGYGYARGGREAARGFEQLTREYFGRGETVRQAALLLVDARHPGLAHDLDAWGWLKAAVDGCAAVATKVDKLARGQRIRAMRELESVLEDSVLPVSAVTGEGLDELWNLIDKLANSLKPHPPRSRNRPLPRATAARPPKK